MREPASPTASTLTRTHAWAASFPATAQQVRHARTALAAFLHGSPLTADAITCLSELASNAVLHSRSSRPGGTFTVHATSTAAWLRVAVHDEGGPWKQPAGHAGLGGRGLHIVTALACHWGKTTGPGDRTVWFTMTTPPPQASPEGTTMTPSHPHHGPAALAAEALTADYPGWDIGHDGQRWTATCPALSLHAGTPEGLRTALEHAINPDHGEPTTHGCGRQDQPRG